jgi:hypothetical protein
MDARLAKITCSKSKSHVNATQGFHRVRHFIITLRSRGSDAIHMSHLPNRYRR